MSLTLSSASARIRRQLKASEKSLAGALAQTSELLATLALAQSEFETAPRGEGHITILRTQAAGRKIVEAQTELLRAHDQLVAISRIMMGPEEDYCPPSAAIPADEVDGDKRVA